MYPSWSFHGGCLWVVQLIMLIIDHDRTRYRSWHGFRMEVETLPRGLSLPRDIREIAVCNIATTATLPPATQQRRRKEYGQRGKRNKITKTRKRNHTDDGKTKEMENTRTIFAFPLRLALSLFSRVVRTLVYFTADRFPSNLLSYSLARLATDRHHFGHR